MAENQHLCALCEGSPPHVGRVCIDGVWLCGPHGKAVAMKRLHLTEADLGATTNGRREVRHDVAAGS